MKASELMGMLEDIKNTHPAIFDSLRVEICNTENEQILVIQNIKVKPFYNKLLINLELK